MAIEIDTGKFEVSKADGVATVTLNDEGAFYQGTDLTKSQIKEVFDHAHDYIEAGTTAAKNIAVKTMEDDKSIDKVFVGMPYGVSKRGGLDVVAKRSHTYPGMNGSADVTKSTLKVAVSDPLTKPAKSFIKSNEAEMTAALLK